MIREAAVNVREHYENHLANYYSWMFGDFDAKLNVNQRFFQRHDIKPTSSKIALDLGAGCGFQSIPLARMGFEVKAIDISRKLLDEIKNNYNILSKNGKLVMTFRDMTFELKDEERFIPVRSDNNRIFTCFLDYYTDYAGFIIEFMGIENGLVTIIGIK